MESFSPDELAYLESIWADKERAEAAFESFRNHLSRKYGLTPWDQFTRQGRILRGAQLPPFANPNEAAAREEPVSP